MEDRSVEIYNLVASLCSLVINSCSEDFFLHYSCFSTKEAELSRELISKRVPVLFRKEKLANEDLTDSLFSELESLISELKDKADFFTILTLLQALDSALEKMLLQKIEEFQDDDFSVVLNTNRESTGIGILPRCSCAWERKTRLAYSYNRLDNFLYNILLLENVILGELIDKHFFLNSDFFPKFAQKRSLRVAATPLQLKKYFETVPYERNRVQYLKADCHIEDNDSLNELVWKKIQLSLENETDIVLFPEMLGNPTMVSFVQAKIKSLPAEQKEKVPSLIILPSCWEVGKNTVTVLDKHGDVLCVQTKQNPFREVIGGSFYMEDINANLVINILHFEGIGRIAILICKDFLTTKYMEQIMRCFKLTLIIVPSYSTGSYDFLRSFDLCAHDDCNVVWINTCSAMEPGKEENFENIGYVRKRIGRNDDEAQMLCKMPICKNAFSGKCDKSCMFFEDINGV